MVFRRGCDGSPLPELPAGADPMSGRGGDGLQGPGRHVQGEQHGEHNDVWLT